jgi:NAD+ kinase
MSKKLDDTATNKQESLKMKFHFVASNDDKASEAFQALKNKYGQTDVKDCDIIVALGGDGFLLHSIREHLDSGKPIYGMNRGTLGFLMNPYELEDLEEKVTHAQSIRLHPLLMEATHNDGSKSIARAFNEVHLMRSSPQAAKIDIAVNGHKPMDNVLVADGVIVATSMGSTGYNLSAHGPIIPIGANVLALTPISPAHPRGWRGALLPNTSEFELTVQDAGKRPVNAVADVVEFKDVASVKVKEDKETTCVLLYEPNHHLSNKIMRAQFAL